MLEGYLKFVRRFLPSPFSIAIILSIITFVMVLFYVSWSEQAISGFEILNWWKDGLFNPALIVFAFQMMMMLVLGHILALTPAANSIIQLIVKHCNTSAKAAAIIAFSALVFGLFNWGLGLIFGAILARKVGEHAKLKQIPINYPLIAAAGYGALMIWHGGLSGSALIKIAEPGHLTTLIADSKLALPETIGLSETVFSKMNLFSSSFILILVPLTLFIVGKKSIGSIPTLDITTQENRISSSFQALIGAEKIDTSQWFLKLTGTILSGYLLYSIFVNYDSILDFFTPNNINILLLALCFLAHKNVLSFLSALDEAIIGSAGILVQFPLYFGIMSLMNKSGLISEVSIFFVAVSNETTFPLFTFLSAGMVNIFVPSGGGQWAIQGPILIKSALALGLDLPKSILALAYGDQITNMLQPFWALPLLGITKLSAKDILPYTLIMFMVGFTVYFSTLLLF
jgi:short-chain fatty acids transporter